MQSMPGRDAEANVPDEDLAPSGSVMIRNDAAAAVERR
jgi:hypothetical protein